MESFALQAAKENYYVAVSRFVPYKHAETIVEAFRELDGQRLVVIGDGPGFARTRARAPANVTLLGFQPFEELRHYMAAAKALIFAAEEDFGITPVEAQACGTPVIAFAGGGALETVRGLEHPKPTGLFFEAQTAAAIAAAVRRFEREGGAIPGRGLSRQRAELRARALPSGLSRGARQGLDPSRRPGARSSRPLSAASRGDHRGSTCRPLDQPPLTSATLAWTDIASLEGDPATGERVVPAVLDRPGSGGGEVVVETVAFRRRRGRAEPRR